MNHRVLNLTFVGSVLRRPRIIGTAPAVPTRNVVYSDSIVKGWVETSGAGLWTIDDDLNVSSITDNAVGDFTINWATSFASANYVIIGTPISNDSQTDVRESTATVKSTSAVRCVVMRAGVGTADPSTGVSVMAIGDQ
ncbi:MAG: hypothetical protein ACRD5H_01070 [Nitrososphaerales archaeon]